MAKSEPPHITDDDVVNMKERIDNLELALAAVVCFSAQMVLLAPEHAPTAMKRAADADRLFPTIIVNLFQEMNIVLATMETPDGQ